MPEAPHSPLPPEPFLVRDYLAADRTVLANERTFLAYQRTALTGFVAELTFIRFFNYRLLEIVGWVLVPLSVLLLLIGVWRYRKMQSRIAALMNRQDGSRT